MGRYEIATKKILEMQAAIEKNDRAAFLKVLNGGYTLSNCSCGDSFLQEKINAVLTAALEKFVN